jgi:hypothetical protein
MREEEGAIGSTPSSTLLVTNRSSLLPTMLDLNTRFSIAVPSDGSDFALKFNESDNKDEGINMEGNDQIDSNGTARYFTHTP